MGKGAVDEVHPLSLGVVSNYMGRTSATHHLRDMVTSADVVVFVGSRTNENGTDAWKLFSRDATFVHIDVDSSEIGRNYEASVRLAGDARANLEALLVALETTDLTRRQAARGAVEEEIATARARFKEAVGGLLSAETKTLRPERVAIAIDAALEDRHSVVVADASYSTIWMGNYMRSRRPGQRFLSPRGLAGLGWGLPMALGAAVAEPDAAVVALVGDGGFGHVWSELETAVREQLPVVVVVLNNGILAFQKHAELVQYKAHTSAVDLGPVDHTLIARGCGAGATRVESSVELLPALREALDSRRTWLLDVICDPEARPPITAWDAVI